MKRLFVILACLVALVGVIIGLQSTKQVTLGWDAMPVGEHWTEIRIYDESTTPETLVTTAPCTSPGIGCPTTSTAFIVTRTAHNYVARSFDGFWESGDSNVIVINAPPKAPINVIKK
jgi:hypothetical protein